MADFSDCTFNEDAISTDEALGACERFVAFRSGNGLSFRLFNDEDQGNRLISKDEVLHFLGDQLENGVQIQVA